MADETTPGVSLPGLDRSRSNRGLGCLAAFVALVAGPVGFAVYMTLHGSSADRSPKLSSNPIVAGLPSVFLKCWRCSWLFGLSATTAYPSTYRPSRSRAMSRACSIFEMGIDQPHFAQKCAYLVD